MHKFPIPIAHDIRPPTFRWSLLRKAALVILGIAVAPLLAEGFSICYVQWSQVMGRNTEAETPVLDYLHEGLESGRHSFWGTISPCFQRVPWSHRLVLAVGVIVVIIGMIMLRM
jgi:hypothetical protein